MILRAFLQIEVEILLYLIMIFKSFFFLTASLLLFISASNVSFHQKLYMFVLSVPQDKWVSRVYQVLKCDASSFHGRHLKVRYHCVVQAGIMGVHHQHTQHS